MAPNLSIRGNIENIVYLCVSAFYHCCIKHLAQPWAGTHHSYKLVTLFVCFGQSFKVTS